MRYFFAATLFTLLLGCKMNEQKASDPGVGSIERTDPALNDLISENAEVEIIGEGYTWSEGPVWIPAQNMLLFSDVPNNVIHKWTEEKGVEQYLKPSGYTGTGEYSREPGSNGLALSRDGKLILCQHGDRRVAAMDAPLTDPKPQFITLSDSHEGKRLNSPNDVTVHSNGDLFFTDPPYGLPKQAEDSTKETPYNGVYRIRDGETVLLVDSLTRPNGIALLNDEKTLLVANSDPDKAIWYAFDIVGDSVSNARVFYDATSNAKDGEKGLPDGFKVDSKGNVFATGPGGVWVFNSTGKVLGKIKLTEAAANCAFSADEKTLYITADMYLLRVKLRD